MDEAVERARAMNIHTKNNVMYRVLLFIRMISTPDKKEYRRIRKELTHNN